MMFIEPFPQDRPMRGWMSPNFGSIGCLGAIALWAIMVLAIAALLYIPWSLVYGE